MKVGQSAVQGGIETQTKPGASRAAETKGAKRSEKGASHSPSLAKAATIPGAKTDISPQSKEFAQAKAVASAAPDVREEKIAALKQRIAEGSYKLKNEKIADRLVDEHLNMAGMS